MTISTIRAAAIVAASILAMIALAACGGGSVTKAEPSSKGAETSAAPTTEESTEHAEQPTEAPGPSEAPEPDGVADGSSDETSRSPSEGARTPELNVTIVPAKKEDIPAAEKAVERLVRNIVEGKGEDACQQIYSARFGGIPTGAHLSECTQGFARDLGGTDPAAVESQLSGLLYSITPDGMVEAANPKQGSSIFLVKTSDDRLLMNADKM